MLSLTGAQLGIWTAQRLEPDSPYYVVGDVVEVRGERPIDVAVLAEAIRATVEEADSLRLRVFETPDGPRQLVSAEPVPSPEVVDLRGAADPEAAAHERVEAERRRVAEACRGMLDRPLFAHLVLRLSESEVWFTQLGHHLVFDGYTAAMLARRTAARYTAFLQGKDVPPSTFARFADLVEADREYRAGDRFQRDREYWRERFTPLPDLDDGGGASGPPEHTVTARSILPASDVARLRELGKLAGTTWGDALIACYAAFLHRVLGWGDVVFALPLMCREGAALRTPAMAVNVLPLRVTVRPEDSGAELTARVSVALKEMRAHQRYRGEDLPQDLAVPGAGALLHGRGINLKAFDLKLDFAGAHGTMRNVAGGPPEDMGLSVLPTSDGGLLLGFEVDARTHDQAAVDAKLTALRCLITAMTEPDGPAVGGADLVPAGERDTLLDAWSTPAPDAELLGVPELLDALEPGRTALVFGDERLTAGELVTRVHRLARALRARGVGPDDVVALALPRSADLVVALLAVLDAGAAFLPLDLAHPVERLRELAAEAGAVLTVATDPEIVPGPHLLLDETDLSTLDGSPLGISRHPEHLAYVIFTSGSTGRPKGVLGRVGGLATLLRHHRATTVAETERAAGRPLRVAHTYSFAFDSALDQLMWLLFGHELHVYGTDVARDADELLAAFARDRIDVVDTTPSMAAPLVDAGLLDRPNPPALLVLGGEATPPALWRRVAESGVRARNMYGPTEATVDGAGSWLDDGEPTIGTAVPGTAVRVLDAALRPAPAGTPGELYLAGPHLARGYLGRPDATAERFVADPYGAPGDRMYRTGDLARWVPGRGLEYLGRRDGQVKVRGHRVELGEVEAALATVPGVRAAAAAVRGPRLVGYVVGDVVPDDVRAELAGRVPEHLVPAAVVVLDSLPLTSNGKIDRAALPAPRAAAGRTAATERERLLCATIAEVIGVEEVAVDDDFFALGGDSITAISVSSRLRAHGLDLRPRDLLARRSFEALAAASAEIAGPAEPPDEPVGEVPAPPIVRALLDSHPDVRTVDGYTQWTAIRLDEDLPPYLLIEGVQTLLDHHDALRLHSEDELRVRERGAVKASDVVIEATGDPAEVAAELAASLDLRTGVLRVALLPGHLVIVIHHLAIDGVSWRILLPDLRAACAGERLEPVGTSWRRHAQLLAEQGTSGARRGELDHWRGALDGPRLGHRPLDRAADTVATARRSVTLASPEQTEAVLTGLPAAYRAGPDDVLLAALVLALRSWRETPVPAETVSLEGHGRDQDGLDLSRTVGWFTAEHPLRVPATAVATAADFDSALEGGDAAGKLLRAAKEAKRAVPDSGSGFGVLRYLDPLTRDELAAVPPPDVVLNYLGRFAALPGTGWKLPEEDPFAVTEPDAKSLEQLLALNCFVREDGSPRLAVEWTAASAVLSAESVEALQEAWARALEALAAHAARIGPDGGGLTPSDLPLVGLGQSDIDELERRGRIEDVLPATPLQTGLSFHTLARGDEDTDVYVVQAVTLLSGALDVDRMREAAAEVLRRHPALRVHLHTTDAGEVVQVVPAAVSLDWRHSNAAREEVAAECRAELARPFDPAAPPLIRFLLLTLGADEHRLVLTNHHALLDGWSMPLVGRTLLATYAELDGGPAAPVAPPLSEYHRVLGERDPDAGLQAWREALAGLDEGTRLAPASVESTVERPERVTVELGGEFSERLRAFARERGITPTTVFQTAWGVLLARLTGRRDVVFGCPVSGRPADVPGVERMVGQLGGTIPVRVRFDPADTAVTVLERVHTESVRLTDHHHTGLPDIQRAAGVGDLFDTMLVMENFPLSSRARTTLAPGLDLVGVDITDATHYPLTVIVLPGDEFTVGLGYQPQAFTRDEAESYGRWLRAVLHEIVTDPARPVARLRALDADEERAMLRLGEGPEPKRERGGALAEFARWVRETPDAEAVVCRNRSLTYAELDRQANRLAHSLIEAGVKPQDPVAVLLRRDVDLVVALFGVFKAGAVHVPMDPDYPADRLAYMLGDIEPAAAVSTSDVDGLPVIDPGHLSLVDTDPSIRLSDDALAYVIYTSGTTGKPKGVAVPHRGVPSLIALQEDIVGIGTAERYLHFASTSFDVAFWQFMLPLLSGGTSVIAPEEVRVSGDDLLAYAAEHRVTGLNLLPSFLSAMPDDATVDPDVFFVVGAERLDPELARRWGNRRALFNAYGPTEVTINSVTWHYDPADPGPLPIGRPDPEVRAYVLDGGLLPVGTNVTGELYLAGPKLAQGYVGRAALTAERFVADPFGPPGERMYRTGDLVRWRPDGQIVFLGRADHQVKLRGFRIELGEIETALTAHDDVRASAVIVREDRLVAYVVPVDGAEPEPAALREYLAADLPAYMVPTAFVPLDRLPLGPSGKLDRTALPAPEARSAQGREPATPAEAVLLRVVRDLLGPGVGLDDGFLEAGGDSIASLRVVSRARREGLHLTARDVLEGGTVAGIAARCGEPARAEEAPAVGDAPLTPIMRDLLLRAEKAADGFCQWVEICVPGASDLARWRSVLDAVLARHDVLRAHLVEDALRVPDVGAVTAHSVLTTVQASGDPRAVLDAQVERIVARMDPRTGPLLRAVLVDAGEERPGRLLLVAHHLVADAVTWRVLLDDVEQAFYGNALHRRGQSFLGWARSLRSAAPHREDESRYWQGISAAPETRLGRTGLDPARDTVATARHHRLDIGADTTHAVLTALPAAYRTGPDTVLLTALARAVGAWRGTRADLLVAVESHGRPGHTPDFAGTVDLAQTAGWFTAVHPARIAPPAGSLPTALRVVRDHLRAAGDGLGHGILGVEGPRPEVAWNYLGRFPSAPVEETPWQRPPDADPLGSGGGADLPLPYALTVNAMVPDGGTLGVRFTWPSALFGDDEIAVLGEHFRRELDELAADLPGPGEVLPLTPLQEVILRESRAADEDPYPVQAAFALSGDLDVDALRAAASALVRRQPNLGAVFPTSHEVQVIPAAPEAGFRVRDVSEVDTALDEELAEPFDLANGPLWRVAVLRQGPERQTLVLTSHHLLSDGWSAPRILGELFALYAGKPLPEPVPPSRYTRLLAAADHSADVRAWRAELDGLPEGDHLPRTGGAAEPALFTVDSALVTELTRSGASRGLTVNMLLQGAWAAVLAAHAGRPDVSFGVMTSNRTSDVDGVEEIIGLLANSVPVRARFTGTVAEALADLQARQQAMAGHHRIGLPELASLAGRERLFDSLLVFENYPVDPAKLREPAPGLTVTGTRFRERTHHPVSVTVVPGQDGWEGVLYARDADARSLAGDLVRFLEELPSWLDGDAAGFVGER
ncbi:non-ribosomal peptide synthetase [Amycolatopsis umgeniensis]|uniref:Amino acid adenylation domain-containing protein/non-ribosomal peptide synthase protein (TIGR01720 family) n=1 Tax=Amycolatopsis umgeniensis TaxID=336628 RepID=A0A841AMZ0_9PSEU|nr:non-ribosomal peptide synthetase [Amycolatopsis umgeniensis]MBB5850089.1 amino acid adenylation domain-containing protein/non-ribosomal peptide synthase protein (TIGR01720 family) [Amycolatopsis umgeniensis]